MAFEISLGEIRRGLSRSAVNFLNYVFEFVIVYVIYCGFVCFFKVFPVRQR